MILSPYERELIVRSIAADRRREAEEIRGRTPAIRHLPATNRQPIGRALRQAVGLRIIRMGARVAGLNARLVAECK